MNTERHTVLITGASAGVGLACARAFVARGDNVVLVARTPGPLEAAATSLGAPDRVWARPADVSDTADMEVLVGEVVARFGGLTGLVNNAGAHHRGEVRSRTAGELGQMVDVNLRAPIVLTALALPHLAAADAGFVVNVASLAGKLPLDGAATYSATKFGLRAFSLALAEELRDTTVRISAVSPGPISTGFILDDLDSVADITFSQTMCTADDVAHMVIACAQDGRRERQFPVSGGRLATLAYLVPSLRRWLRPALEAKGRRVKERLRAERG